MIDIYDIHRKEVLKDPKIYEIAKEIFSKEYHHSHIIDNIDGILRWRMNKDVRAEVDRKGLSNIIGYYNSMGLDRNSEEMRKLYRDIGSSLFVYWETFYWEVNNKDAHLYRRDKIRDEKINNLLK